MVRKVLPIVVMVTLFLALISYADSGEGGYAGAYSRMGLSARALGMGGAYVAVADDGFGSSFNPAGIIQLQNATFSASYRLMDLDRRVSFISYHQPIRGNAVFGGYWINSGVGNVETRDDQGEITGELSNYENAVTACFAKMLIKELTLGINVRYSQYNLANLNSYTVGFDFGVFAFPVEKLRLGLSVQNLGMQYSWVSSDYWQEFDQFGTDTEDKFPVNIRMGGSYFWLKDKLLVSLEVDKNTKQKARMHFGAEYKGLEYLAGRLGYNDGSLTFGLGFKHQVKSVIIELDYAFLSDQVGINPDHLVSMDIEFTQLFK
ncbi:MAG: PorV/PorQ family protein [candidate division Zixibacteria bacterium]|nr:PorV/PorQ family protein [candidate division Zixibacteria bacterium]